jgi:hypothetical protein
VLDEFFLALLVVLALDGNGGIMTLGVGDRETGE